MSPFEQDVILPALRSLNQRLGAINAITLALRMERPERTVRHYLRRMELAGAVSRPYGARKGWLAGDIQLSGVSAAV